MCKRHCPGGLPTASAAADSARHGLSFPKLTSISPRGTSARGRPEETEKDKKKISSWIPAAATPGDSRQGKHSPSGAAALRPEQPLQEARPLGGSGRWEIWGDVKFGSAESPARAPQVVVVLWQLLTAWPLAPREGGAGPEAETKHQDPQNLPEPPQHRSQTTLASSGG